MEENLRIVFMVFMKMAKDNIPYLIAILTVTCCIMVLHRLITGDRACNTKLMKRMWR